MLLSIKIFILVVCYILSAGIFFKKYFREHTVLVILSGIIALVGTVYLGKDVCEEMGYCQEKPDLSPTEPSVNQFLNSTEFQDRLKVGGMSPKMVWIKGGSFQMGGDGYHEHKVFVDRFAIGKFEVTFAEYDKFAAATGREKPDDEGWGRDDRPVIYVSWDDATAYAKWLSEQTGKTYRLPTEAEWEYAARAGTTTKYPWGNNIGSNKANCYGDDCGDSFEYTAPVGSFAPNPWGLHDTVGNVWEWVQDWHDSNYYKNSPTRNPSGPSKGKFRVLRGSAWAGIASDSQSADRGKFWPAFRDAIVGFRLLRMP